MRGTRTLFYNRAAAAQAFRFYRSIWSREAAWNLTVVHHGFDYTMRLVAAMVLAAFAIPRNGKAPGMTLTYRRTVFTK